MNFCPNCGTALKENANFCTACGHTIQTAPAAPAPVEPVYQEPVYTYQPPVSEAPREPRKGMNFAALIIVLLTALLWLFAPLVANYGISISSYQLFSSVFNRLSYFERLINNYPVVLAPFTILFCWIFCFAFTLGKKMPPVRVFAAISTGLSSLWLFLQIVISGNGVAGVGYGFWGIYLGTIVLIVLGGTRYKKD